MSGDVHAGFCERREVRSLPATHPKVYVRSERAGQRVMASLTGFIEGRLRLKVNKAKSAVARPEDRHFLGFRLRVDPQTGTVEVLLSERTKRNAMERVQQLTPRNWGGTLVSCVARINAWLRGWHGFFGIASVEEMQTMRKIDAHLRRRLRAILLRHWKRKRTIARNLVKLGVPRRSAWRQVYQGRRSWWALSHIPAVDHGLNRAFFRERGLVAVVEMHRRAPSTSAPPDRHNWRYGDDFEVDQSAGGGGHNPPSRRAVYDQRTYGSVGAGAGNRPGYPRAPTACAPSGGGRSFRSVPVVLRRSCAMTFMPSMAARDGRVGVAVDHARASAGGCVSGVRRRSRSGEHVAGDGV